MAEISGFPSLSDLVNQGMLNNFTNRPSLDDLAKDSFQVHKTKESQDASRSAQATAGNGSNTFAMGGASTANAVNAAPESAGAAVDTSFLRQPLSGGGASALAGSVSGGVDAPGFSDMFEGMIKGVHHKQLDAADKKRDVLLGKSDNIHEAMVSVQEAGVAFNLMLEVRNKLVDSYRELLRMRV